MLTFLLLLSCAEPTSEDIRNGKDCLIKTAQELQLTPRGIVCKGQSPGRLWITCKTYPEELNNMSLEIGYRTSDNYCVFH